MRLAIRLAIPALIAGVTLVACASTATPAASAPPKATVNIKGFAFSPVTLEIAKGTVVTWHNQDSTTHTLTSGANRTKDGKFDKQLSGDAEDSVTFDTAGTLDYFCSFHSSMNAKVVVK